MLNGQPMGGKRRSAYFYDLWTLKYLPRFKWDHLTGARQRRGKGGGGRWGGGEVCVWCAQLLHSAAAFFLPHQNAPSACPLTPSRQRR